MEINSSRDTKKMKISGNLNGAGDSIWYDSDASKHSYPVIKGKVSFSGNAAFSAP